MTHRLSVAIIIISMYLLGSCSPAVETLTCDFSNTVTVEGRDADFEGLWHGLYSSDQGPAEIAASCFQNGRHLGIAELACALIESLDDGDGGYTLLFTDEDGETYPVAAAEHILIGPDAESLRGLALKFPYLSACPTLAPPVEVP